MRDSAATLAIIVFLASRDCDCPATIAELIDANEKDNIPIAIMTSRSAIPRRVFRCCTFRRDIVIHKSNYLMLYSYLVMGKRENDVSALVQLAMAAHLANFFSPITSSRIVAVFFDLERF
jgi:ribosomal protein L7Ae-like RNA K-turn-binding protein